MLVKSLSKADHISHLSEAFEVVRNHKMMLNPSKCAFGVVSGNCLGHMVSKKGIEANPDKIKSILDMESPRSIKDVQKLTGRIAALRRLVVAQVSGEFEAMDDTMAKYLRVVKGILAQFDEWCQRHAPIVRQPPERLASINIPISFAMWGMDILGPFPIASGQRKFIVVAIDYFTKLIEAKALAKITTKKIAQFFWENVICRYGIPRILVTDNGKQFDNAEFREYCDDNNIELRFTSVAHPQANGRAKVVNRIILDGLKKSVECSRNTWVDELLPILWAYRTTCKVTTEATPFMLVYRSEAVVPLEITHASPRIEAYEPETNEEGMRLALDLIEEARDEGDLVLRKIEASGALTGKDLLRSGRHWDEDPTS
ncbi:uncharacterized protein LOC141719086 [Apium graveolens]|uniref:uncharacterized protein LOC141719086 n=1 Tax=Apium graveolens TaxID=4045 RepID=UPI003D7A4595